VQWKGVSSKYLGEYPKQKLVSHGVGIDKDGTVIKAGIFGTFPFFFISLNRTLMFSLTH